MNPNHPYNLDPLKELIEEPFTQNEARKCVFTNFDATEMWQPPWVSDEHNHTSKIPVNHRYITARENPVFGDALKSREKKLFQIFWKMEMIVSLYGYDNLKFDYRKEFRYLQGCNLIDMGFKDMKDISEAKKVKIEEMLDKMIENRLNRVYE